jgi:hypothetical protein
MGIAIAVRRIGFSWARGFLPVGRTRPRGGAIRTRLRVATAQGLGNVSETEGRPSAAPTQIRFRIDNHVRHRLAKLYLEPLQELVDRRGSVYGDGLPLHLWIDIKSPEPALRPLLRAQLWRYPMLRGVRIPCPSEGAANGLAEAAQLRALAAQAGFPLP